MMTKGRPYTYRCPVMCFRYDGSNGNNLKMFFRKYQYNEINVNDVVKRYLSSGAPVWVCHNEYDASTYMHTDDDFKELYKAIPIKAHPWHIEHNEKVR